MGGNISVMDQKAAKARSDEISEQIEAENGCLKRECKVLIMGTHESGASTLLNQIKITHQGGFSEAELTAFRSVVYKNVMESAYEALKYMTKAGLNWVDGSNLVLADKVLDFHVATLWDTHSYISLEIAEAINQLWKDPIMPTIMDELCGRFDSMDTVGYFLSEVLRIAQPDYIPNEMDVLRAHYEPVGISETRFTTGKLAIHLINVGIQRSERREWIQNFENVTSIVFCAALSGYDQVREGQTQTQMAESLVLLDSVINSRWFLPTSTIVLFLTKIDVFKKKLQRVPLAHYFPEYTGGTDVNKAVKYILWKFMQTNRARLSVYPALIQAPDTTSIRLVISAIREAVLQNELGDSAIP
ncbi:heterotrimeric G-protein alpha subunit, GPA3-like protein [Coprinopsis sp. MPI-PUGE-AT-0042]|nr:heterotrimeric G-protein alpha subunit, GPA3-like protein [Coprinopsis sp. MPI-PUGE-AT-0042]